MIPDAKLERVLDRFHAIEAQLASGHTNDFAKLSKEHAQLAPVVSAIQAYRTTQAGLVDSEAMRDDPSTDPELKAMAAEEADALRKRFGALEKDVQLLLLPKDAADSSSAIRTHKSIGSPPACSNSRRTEAPRSPIRVRISSATGQRIQTSTPSSRTAWNASAGLAAKRTN
jgi:hypothetical protein